VVVHDGHKFAGQRKQVGLGYLGATASEDHVAGILLDEVAAGYALVGRNIDIVPVAVAVAAVVAVLAVEGESISAVTAGGHWEAHWDLLILFPG
jgi:hypothetical protein